VFVGKGCVYSFDPVGSYEREVYRAGGSAGAILQPLLDNQVLLPSHWTEFNRDDCVIPLISAVL